MAIKDISVGRTDVYKLAPDALHIKPDWNTRDIATTENVDHIEQLSRSIAEIGVREPLKVMWEDNKAYITNGHCRYHAIMLAIKNGAEIKSVPVMVEERFSNEADRIFTQIASNSGKPFTQLEQAKVFKKLLDLGWSQKDIASKAGLSGGRVSQILELLTLPEPVKAMVANGEVSASMAVQTVKADGAVKATENLTAAVKEAKKDGKTRAMPKHTGERGPSPMAVVKATIEKAFEDQRFDESEEMITITFPEPEWQKILKALKL